VKQTDGNHHARGRISLICFAAESLRLQGILERNARIRL
jgi:hypothetical protein